MDEDERIELLAEYAHTAWSGWMVYLFRQVERWEDGKAVLSKWAVDRWKRQSETPYSELSEEEKESDRKEARTILAILDHDSPQ